MYVGSVVVLFEDVRADFLHRSENQSPFYPSEAIVRRGDLDLYSPKVHGPRGRLIGPGRVWIWGDEVSYR